jgi:hypothetical protein
MKIEWTPNGALISATLGDDANKFAVVVEQLGGQSLAQIEQLAGGANPALFPRGNVGGEFVFRSSQTYANYETTFAQFKTEYARLNRQGTLVVTITTSTGTATLTLANAILKSVQRIFDAQSSGAHMAIRYSFAITTITT